MCLSHLTSSSTLSYSIWISNKSRSATRPFCKSHQRLSQSVYFNISLPMLCLHIHECVLTQDNPFELFVITTIYHNYHTFHRRCPTIFCYSPNTTSFLDMFPLIYFVDKSMFPDEKTLMLYFMWINQKI